jgi:hypothetical protein
MFVESRRRDSRASASGRRRRHAPNVVRRISRATPDFTASHLDQLLIICLSLAAYH